MTKEDFPEYLNIINSKRELKLESWWDIHPRIVQFLRDNPDRGVIGYYRNEGISNFYVVINLNKESPVSLTQVWLFDDKLTNPYELNLRQDKTNAENCRLTAFINALNS